MSDNRNEWWLGMSLVLRRPLGADERQSLTHQVTRLRAFGLAAVAMMLPTLIAGFALLIMGSETAGGLTASLPGIGGLLLMVAGLPLQVIFARDAFRRSRGLAGDLRSGYVKRFAGAVTSEVLAEGTLLRLWKQFHDRNPDADENEWWVEVLPASRRVWRVLDQPVKAWVLAPSVEVAETPAFAAIAAEWLEPIHQQEDQTLLAGQREMSEAEREELRRYAQRAWTFLLPVAVGMTLWLSFPLALFIQGSRTGDLRRLVLLAVLTLLTDWRFANAVRLSRKMARDVNIGRVLILRAQRNAAPDSASSIPPVGDILMDTVELLPISRWMWTENGSPARWRRTPVSEAV